MVTYLGTFSKTSAITVGKRVAPRLSYVAKSQLGRIVSVPAIKSDTEFSILKEEGFGTLATVFNTDKLYLATVSIGKIIKDRNPGISTIGIGYVPGSTAPADKSLRRWPRDWHGDNMNG